MQSITVPLVVLLSCSTARTQDVPTPSSSLARGSSAGVLLESQWFQGISARIDRAEYEFTAVEGEPGVWSAPNRSQALRSRVTRDGLELFSRATAADGAGAPWSMKLRTSRFGRGATSALGCATIEVGEHRAELDHGVLTEWFENRSEGLEQGWTIASRPAGAGPLRIGIELEGGFEFHPDNDGQGGTLRFEDVEIPYRGLVAYDATGALLEASLEPTGSGLIIEVDDEGAVYPVIVDPVLSGPAWTTESNQVSASYGTSLAIVGDVNGDGYDDILVGAPLYDAGQDDEGRAWLFYGGANGPSQGSSWYGSSGQADSHFGEVVAAAGDVNGDGYDDVLIAAPQFDNGEDDEGLVWGYYGSPTGLPAGSSWFFDGDQEWAQLGRAMAAAGDINGDGYDDVLLAAPYYDDGETNEGRVWAFHGSASGLPLVSSWFASSNQEWSLFGFSVAGAGDVNNDGFDDILIGAPLFDAPEANEGRVWRYNGGPAGLPAGSSWYVESDLADCQFGLAVAGAGDVNNDGFDDVLIGAPYFDGELTDEGRAWVFHGGWTNPTSSDWYREGNQMGARFGSAVAGAGDVNGDGYDDVIVAAVGYDSGQDDEGRVWVHLGSPLGLASVATWTAEGNQAFARFGTAVAGGGDLNGDGFSDVLVGAPGYDAGETNEGRSYAYTGSPFLGSSYCLSTLNSTGSPATISATGSPIVSAASLQLQAVDVPTGLGLFIHAPNQIQVPFGNGYLCVGGGIVRGVPISNSTGVMQYTYDGSTPQHSLANFAGTTRNFQAWFRDPAGGGASFDLSDGVTLLIHP